MADQQDAMTELSEEIAGLNSGDGDESSTSKPLSEKSSYYYAHSSVSPEGPKTLVGAQTIYNHKPLNQDEVQKLQVKRMDSEGESAWNQGGTWEEKDFSKMAEKALKEELKQLATPKNRATFKEVSAVEECHCGVIFSRGKKKQFLEVEKLEIKWTATEGAGKGKLEVTELSSAGDADDLVLKVTFREGKDDDPLPDAERRGLEQDLKASAEVIKRAADSVLAQIAAGPTGNFKADA